MGEVIPHIVHLHWPEKLAAQHGPDKAFALLLELVGAGSRIVQTIHNVRPHDSVGVLDEFTDEIDASTTAVHFFSRSHEMVARSRRPQLPEPVLHLPAGRPADVRQPGCLRPSRRLVEVAAEILGAHRLTLVIDDLSPGYLYDDLDADDLRDAWSSVARAARCEIALLSDRGSTTVADDIVRMLRALSTADVEAATPRSLGTRVRGGATGYDALHLAMMAVAADTVPDSVVVCRASDMPGVQRLEQVLRVRGTLAATGLDTGDHGCHPVLEMPLSHVGRAVFGP